MSDLFRDEVEACAHLNDVVLQHSGVPSGKIFFPNMQQMELTQKDEWMLVSYIIGTSGVSLYAGASTIKRTTLTQELLYFELIGTGTLNSNNVYRNLNTFYNGYAVKSLTYFNRRSIMRDGITPISDLVGTHKPTRITYTFNLDFLE